MISIERFSCFSNVLLLNSIYTGEHFAWVTLGGGGGSKFKEGSGIEGEGIGRRWNGGEEKVGINEPTEIMNTTVTLSSSYCSCLGVSTPRGTRTFPLPLPLHSPQYAIL